MALESLDRYRFYLRQRPTLLVVLSVLAVLLFLGVTGLSHAYQRQRESLGTRWFTRGVTDLSARRYEAAVTEFRSALLYSRDDYSYRLNLAEALIGLKRTGEASAYLLNLWDRTRDTRYDDSYTTVYYANNPTSIPKDASGNPKFAVGDTAIWMPSGPRCRRIRVRRGCAARRRERGQSTMPGSGRRRSPNC